MGLGSLIQSSEIAVGSVYWLLSCAAVLSVPQAIVQNHVLSTRSETQKDTSTQTIWSVKMTLRFRPRLYPVGLGFVC